jgi:hypothetical protein
MTAWHEDDRFWLAVQVALNSDRRASYQADAAALAKLAGLANGAEVLDLCCALESE